MAAMDYLLIQGSAVQCKHIFSSVKEMMSDWRNQILYRLMEQLQMLNFAFNKDETLHFTSGTEEKDIIAYLESTLGGVELIPEDINMFMQSLLSHSPSETDL